MDDLRTALQTLTAEQPHNCSRAVEVRGLIRRRARRRTAAAGVLGVAALAGAAAVVLPSGDPARESLPARPAPGPVVSLDWEPRGELVDEAGVAVRAWGPAQDVRVLYAGNPVDPLSGRRVGARWYAFEATGDAGRRVVIARDRDGAGPAGVEVLADRPASEASDRQVSVLLTDVGTTGDDVVWPGKPGTQLRDTLFVLPAPGTERVSRRFVRDEAGDLGVVSLPPEPSVSTYDAEVVPTSLQIDGRGGRPLPALAPDPRVQLAPPLPPDGWVLVSGGSGGQSGQELTVPVQVVARCTGTGGGLTVTYDTASTSTTTEVACDGLTQGVFGVLDPVGSFGVTQEGVGAGEFRLTSEPSPGVERFQVWLAVSRLDAVALGLTGFAG